MAFVNFIWFIVSMLHLNRVMTTAMLYKAAAERLVALMQSRTAFSIASHICGTSRDALLKSRVRMLHIVTMRQDLEMLGFGRRGNRDVSITC